MMRAQKYASAPADAYPERESSGGVDNTNGDDEDDVHDQLPSAEEVCAHQERRKIVTARTAIATLGFLLFLILVASMFFRGESGGGGGGRPDGSEAESSQSSSSSDLKPTTAPTSMAPITKAPAKMDEKPSNADTAEHQPADDDADPPTERPSGEVEKVEKVACKHVHECQMDRLGHNSPLYWGDAICNRNFMVSFTESGVFQWHDCDSNETHVYFNASAYPGSYFVFREDASWNVVFPDGDGDDGRQTTLLWEKNCSREVHPSPTCLHHPLLDCPYLHLRKSGIIVLNYIDENKGWMAEKVYHVYDDLNQWLRGD